MPRFIRRYRIWLGCALALGIACLIPQAVKRPTYDISEASFLIAAGKTVPEVEEILGGQAGHQGTLLGKLLRRGASGLDSRCYKSSRAEPAVRTLTWSDSVRSMTVEFDEDGRACTIYQSEWGKQPQTRTERLLRFLARFL